jgi:hypothetical protein
MNTNTVELLSISEVHLNNWNPNVMNPDDYRALKKALYAD